MSLRAGTEAAYTLDDARRPADVSERLRSAGVHLDSEEVSLLVELLGRPPSWPEAVLFGILWSEHCSYKSTRHLLGRLPTTAPQVLIGPGEDAGVVRLPGPVADMALVLAHESHNHPSQVLPVEGAATGVGGIVRDIACMGATVVGVLDALRFGDPRSSVHVRDVVRGVVQGVADYGNALGVPNLGGDATFDRAYDTNCLVNVMAVGLVPANGILRSRVPAGDGPWAFVLVGKPTDDSGFGGAAFASRELGSSAGDARGAVQIPDPFLKRVLSVANEEAFRRIRERDIPAGFKDLGAGGVACATSELAAAGGCGATIQLDRVPRIERSLSPEVLLCAETQERFCWVVPQAFAAELCDIYNRDYALASIHPGAAAAVIGVATHERRYRVDWRGDAIVDCPVEAITSARRVVRRARRRTPAPPAARKPATVGLRDAVLTLARSVELGSREYLYRHYDGEVQGRTCLRPGEADAVVLRVRPDLPTGIAFAVGGNAQWCAADPELGARHAVAEAARNVACAGARPWALTDCLNFGDPEDADVMGDFEATLEGLAVAAEALGGLAAPDAALPFVSGNVSLYNHAGASAIPPTPIVMAAGVVTRVDAVVPLGVTRPGDLLVLVGEPRDELTGSAWLRIVFGEPGGAPPSLDLGREARLQELAVTAAESRWVTAAHDVSDGGLAIALVEMLLGSPAQLRLGLDIDATALEAPAEEALFSERAGIVFALRPERAPRLFQESRDRSLLAWPLGQVVVGGTLRVRAGRQIASWTAAELREARNEPLERLWNEEIEA